MILGVELARQHHDSAAVTALRQAVGADPSYALGWFNLGVLEERRGPLHLPASQGAFAKAFALDPTLKDRRHDLTIDASVYRTALDLSKPLPPQWSLAETQKAVPVATAGLLAALLLAVGLARSSSPGGTDLAKQWLEPLGERLDGVRGLTRLRHPAWAVVATVATFLLAYLHHAGSPTEIAAYVLGVLVLTGTAMYARVAIAVARERRDDPDVMAGRAWHSAWAQAPSGCRGRPCPSSRPAPSPPGCTSLPRSPWLRCPACSLWNRPGWVSRSPSHSRSWPSSWPVPRCYRSSHSTERTSAKQASPPQPESSEGPS